ncbi:MULTISPECIES: hypothetical protein [Shewanella]|uniref:Transposase n=2 Tax=Shewanella TaxID=22 RepID=A0ABM7BZ60_9GAMM|nr:hypothetical protein [Shewanella psychromarinicola]AZG35451.1 hypothetical protein EGC80_11370 [Shewanella psychromarinicola]MCL1084108.1 hypothetical protein [Shewanella psychromarinicola]
MSNSDLLSTLSTAFECWRSNRNGRQVPTPNTLREQAVGLLEHYSSSKITSVLRISGSQLKQWRNSISPPVNNPQFVHLPILAPSTQTTFNVELKFFQGDTMSL